MAIEAAILLWRGRRAAVAAVVVVGAALLPLLHEQLRGDHADNVTQGVGLATRTKGVVTSWIVGERGAAIDNLEWLGGALLIAGAVLAIRRREALMPAVVGGGGAALMLLTALGGADYINNRNTIAVLAIVLAVPAIGYAAGRAGVWVGGATCIVLLAATIGALIDPAHAREDWRSAARKVTRARGARHARLPVDPAALVRARAAPGADVRPPASSTWSRPEGCDRRRPRASCRGSRSRRAGSGSPATPRRPRSRCRTR